MPRLPALPKVAFDWTEEMRGNSPVAHAKCRLCYSSFYGYSRNAVYPSTSKHKTTCRVFVKAQQEHRRLEREATERKMIELGLDPER